MSETVQEILLNLKFSVELLGSGWKRGGDGNEYPSTGKTKCVCFGNVLQGLGDVKVKQKGA